MQNSKPERPKVTKLPSRASLKRHEVTRNASLRNKRMTDCLSVFLCIGPSSPHSFGLIGMKIGMDTAWDLGSDMDK